MNVQLSTVSNTRKNLVVTLDTTEVDTEYKAVVGAFARRASLPGFRPGKAPEAMILKRFGREIGEEFRQKIVEKAYRGALDQEKLDVISIVKVEEGKIEPGLEASITAVVDVRPDFSVTDYVGLAVTVDSPESSDAEVDAVIENMRSERADFKTADRPSAKGDYLKLAYEGTVDGRPIAEIAPDKQLYGSVPQTWEEVEGTQEGVLPGLSAQISGLKAGDKRTVTVTFPADFGAVPALAGKTAEYAVSALEVREKVLPALDEAFFKANKADSLDDMRVKIRNSLRVQKEVRNRSSIRGQVSQILADRADFEPPQSLIDSETESLLRQFMEENLRRGVPAEQFEKDKKELFEGARKSATGRVKVQMILGKIAQAEKIDADANDLERFIQAEARRSNSRPEKVAKEISRDNGILRSVHQSIVLDKTVDFLVSKANVTIKSTT